VITMTVSEDDLNSRGPTAGWTRSN